MTRTVDSSTFADRARAALIAHACGDRFGAPLKFVKDASVHTRPVYLWRSGSALGLAVAAALPWSEDLGLAVEKAARIRGDSDSVACLAGVLLGAALGTAAIRAQRLDTLPQRDDIAALADRLLGLTP